MASRQNLQIEVPVKLNLAMQEAQSQIQAFKNQLKNLSPDTTAYKALTKQISLLESASEKMGYPRVSAFPNPACFHAEAQSPPASAACAFLSPPLHQDAAHYAEASRRQLPSPRLRPLPWHERV